jgi:hypothetical protein
MTGGWQSEAESKEKHSVLEGPYAGVDFKGTQE